MVYVSNLIVKKITDLYCGINKDKKSKKLDTIAMVNNFYPNQAIDIFTLISKEKFEDAFLEITNISGKTVKKLELHSLDDLHNISNSTIEEFPNGVYTLKVSDNSEILHKTRVFKAY